LCDPVFNSNLIQSLQAASHALEHSESVPSPAVHTNAVLEMKGSVLASKAVLVLLRISSASSTTDTPRIASRNYLTAHKRDTQEALMKLSSLRRQVPAIFGSQILLTAPIVSTS